MDEGIIAMLVMPLVIFMIFVAPIWLGIAVWVTQKNNMKRVLVYQLITLFVLIGLIAAGLYYG